MCPLKTQIQRRYKLVYLLNLFYVRKKIKENQIKPELIDSLKNYLDCDVVLKQNNQEGNLLIFLVLIPIAEIVESIPK